MASGARLRSLTGHAEAVHAVAFSPDGSRLSSASSDRTLRIWDVASGECVLTVPAPEAVYATDWSPDGSRVAMVMLDKTLRILDAEPAAERAKRPHGGAL